MNEQARTTHTWCMETFFVLFARASFSIASTISRRNSSVALAVGKRRGGKWQIRQGNNSNISLSRACLGISIGRNRTYP